MPRILTYLFLILSLSLSACQVSNFGGKVTPSEEISPTNVEPAVSSHASETFTPMATSTEPEVSSQDTLKPTPPATQVVRTPIPPSILPVFVYVEGNTLMEQVGDNPPERIADLPGVEFVQAAEQVGDSLFVMHERGIHRIRLPDGESELAISFDLPVLFGSLVTGANDNRIYYSVTVDDRTTFIGFYDLEGGAAHQLFSLPGPQGILVLGMTNDSQSLYGLPRGQDPDFDHILLIDPDQGVDSRELPVEGYDVAALSPDSRLMATYLLGPISSDQPESLINLYDLSLLPDEPTPVFKLPNAPSHIGFGGLHWSPDGQQLYFMLIGNQYEAPATESYGLWRLDVESGEMDQVAPLTDPALHAESVSPDGQWILIRPETEDKAMMINLQTGESISFSVPVLSTMTGWR